MWTFPWPPQVSEINRALLNIKMQTYFGLVWSKENVPNLVLNPRIVYTPNQPKIYIDIPSTSIYQTWIQMDPVETNYGTRRSVGGRPALFHRACRRGGKLGLGLLAVKRWACQLPTRAAASVLLGKVAGNHGFTSTIRVFPLFSFKQIYSLIRLVIFLTNHLAWSCFGQIE